MSVNPYTIFVHYYFEASNAIEDYYFQYAIVTTTVMTATTVIMTTTADSWTVVIYFIPVSQLTVRVSITIPAGYFGFPFA